ncbi:MAG: TMEM175 family protein [Solirubrobacterales bacterium]
MEANAGTGDQVAEQEENRSRLAALTDGVIAIAITLLVLEIAVPVVPEALVDEELGDALWDLRAQVFGFVLSFAIIGYYWLSHRLVFSHLERADVGLTLINLFFLLMVAFIPFVSALISDYAPNTTAVVIYAGVMTLAGLSQLAMMVYPAKRGHFHASVSMARVSVSTEKIAVAPLVFILSIPLAFASGWAAIAFWALIPIARIAINRRNRSGSPDVRRRSSPT